MIESGQQFGLYVVKDVFEASESQACCCAEDPFFNREVSLKVLSADRFVENQRLEELEELFERLAVLDHPSIAPIYDSGLEENSFYYTSPCFNSDSLVLQMLSPLAAEDALKITFELADALDYAEQHNFSPTQLDSEKIFFDEEGRAVFTDFCIDSSIEQILTASAAEQQASTDNLLRQLGELLLQMLIGPEYDLQLGLEAQCARVGNAKIRRLVSRFLLPGEQHFSSFGELLEELRGFEEVEEQLSAPVDESEPPPTFTAERGEAFSATTDQTDQMVADVRRLVAEKNSLQQALDSAVFERNQADEKIKAGQRQLSLAKQEVQKAKEEANVAWELVAGQKSDRWRPAAWAFGGFLIGFVLSGSYGYYYSEQTRNELLAKLKANEELIKAAAWRTAEQQPGSQGKVAQNQQLATEVPQDTGRQVAKITVEPIAEEAQQWWPAGSEFSAAAAIPMEKIKAALGFSQPPVVSEPGLPDRLRQEVTTVIERWAQAWSQQDLGEYFSAYSEHYRPELGRSQQEWREFRRNRVTRPKWIELDIDNIHMRKVDESRIQVKLKQSYRSDFYQDQILKSINLIKEDGEWRILMERSLGMVASTNDIVGG